MLVEISGPLPTCDWASSRAPDSGDNSTVLARVKAGPFKGTYVLTEKKDLSPFERHEGGSEEAGADKK